MKTYTLIFALCACSINSMAQKTCAEIKKNIDDYQGQVKDYEKDIVQYQKDTTLYGPKKNDKAFVEKYDFAKRFLEASKVAKQNSLKNIKKLEQDLKSCQNQ